MTYRHSSISEIRNEVGAKTYLEFTVHLLDNGYFNPVVFCHDNFWFDRKRYAQVLIGFINLLSFLYSCGITLDTEITEPADIEAELYRNIMRDGDISEQIQCYELLETDFTGFSLEAYDIPENCEDEDFYLVRLYLQMRTGAALDKKAIEKIAKKKFTDAQMVTLRKQLEDITGRKVLKRKDNSYEMR